MKSQDADKAGVALYSVKRINGNGFELVRLSMGHMTRASVGTVKFSPPDMERGGRMRLGCGAHDKHLYFYDMPDEAGWLSEWESCLEEPIAVYNKHSSAITAFDFNVDGSYFQSNCQAGELLYACISSPDDDKDNYDGHGGGATSPTTPMNMKSSGKINNSTTSKSKSIVKQETSATRMADFNGVALADPDTDYVAWQKHWSSHSCMLGWPVQGIWAPGMDGSDINCCDRDPTESLLATADDFGHVKVFRYPAVSDTSKFVQMEGHSSHCTGVRWTMGEHLVSVGGNDKCVFVWRVEKE